MADDAIRGKFVWHELLTTDTTSGGAFYSKVVGWKTTPWPNDPSYTLFNVGKRPVAGLMVLPDDAKKMGAPPHWLMYVGAGSVDDTSRRVSELGGKVLKPAEDVPGAGRFAVVADPYGAVFGLYTPPPGQPLPGAPVVGDFSWHELMTDNLDGAWAFYEKLCGWQKTSAMDMGPEMGVYQMFSVTAGGPPAGGMMKRPAQVPVSNWMPYAMVADTKKSAATATKLGGKIVNGPMEVPGGDLIAQGVDLQGAYFAVHSLKAAAAAPKPAKKAAAKAVAKKPVAKAAAKKKPVKAAKAKGRAKAKPAAKKKASKKKASRPARRAAKSSKKRAGRKR
jgi:hypothetical protein